jgi:hypothetical protein
MVPLAFSLRPVPALLFVYKEMVFNHATFGSTFSCSCVILYPFLISLPLLLCYELLSLIPSFLCRVAVLSLVRWR